jgi:alpha-L-fucosidase 2
MSPEVPHHVQLNAVVCEGPTLDILLIKDLFNAVIQTETLFNIDSLFREEVQQALNQLPPLQIGKLGQLQEWFQDWDQQADINNRHMLVLNFLFLINLCLLKVSFVLCISWKFSHSRSFALS